MMKSFIYGSHPGIVEEVIRPIPILKSRRRQQQLFPYLFRKNQQNQIQKEVLVQVYAVGLNPVDTKEVVGDKIPYTWKWLRSIIRSLFIQGNIIGFEFSGIIVDDGITSTSIISDSGTTGTCTNTSPTVYVPGLEQVQVPPTINPLFRIGDTHQHQQHNQQHNTYRIGDKVYGTVPPFHGTLAEYIIVPVDQIAYKPRYYYSPPSITTRTGTGITDSSSASSITGSSNNRNDLDNNSNDDSYNKIQHQQQQQQQMVPVPVSFVQAAAIPLVTLTVMQCLDEIITSATKTTSSAASFTGDSSNNGNNNNNNNFTEHIDNNTSTTKKSILIIGGSGGTGHVAIQMCTTYWNKYIHHIVCISSKKNTNFCYNQGATEVIPYDDIDDNNDNNNNNNEQQYATSTCTRLVSNLQKSKGVPFDIIFDCVTSDDPRDYSIVHYPTIIQDCTNKLVSTGSSSNNKNKYRRLGGPTSDWIRAGIERIFKNYIPLSFIWSSFHEKLFWIQFPKSNTILQHITYSIENNLIQPPQIVPTNVYPFTKHGIENAFTIINSRRVQGKVVIQVRSSSLD